MMNALGVKIVIVAGNRFQLERNLRIRGVPLRNRGIRIPAAVPPAGTRSTRRGVHPLVLGALGVGCTRWDPAVACGIRPSSKGLRGRPFATDSHSWISHTPLVCMVRVYAQDLRHRSMLTTKTGSCTKWTSSACGSLACLGVPWLGPLRPIVHGRHLLLAERPNIAALIAMSASVPAVGRVAQRPGWQYVVRY
jgi:hypothetical protein